MSRSASYPSMAERTEDVRQAVREQHDELMKAADWALGTCRDSIAAEEAPQFSATGEMLAVLENDRSLFSESITEGEVVGTVRDAIMRGIHNRLVAAAQDEFQTLSGKAAPHPINK